MSMNDPHVAALEYRIEHGPDIVDWSRAAPLDREEDGFRVCAGNGRVRFEFKEHHASEEAARFAVEAHYIPNWELLAGLALGPDAFTLRFDRSEIVDREPPPGPLALRGLATAGPLKAVGRLPPPAPPAFPEPPPTDIERSPDVDSMFSRYLGHLQGREPLPGMACFCFTVFVWMVGGGVAEAARHFGVSRNVLVRVRKLTAYKGGDDARKEDGRNAPYTPDEERFLKSAIGKLIRRAAEVECGPDPSRPKITLADI